MWILLLIALLLPTRFAVQNYEEYFWDGIHATPHLATMRMLDNSSILQDVLENIPDNIDDKGDFPVSRFLHK